jgi:hypothetical protein
MQKGLLFSDRVDPQKILTKREHILQKYSRQQVMMKSKLQTAINKKASSNSNMATMKHELQTITMTVEEEEEWLVQLKAYHLALGRIIGK